MSSFKLICDGSCDLDDEVAKKKNIEIVPFYVSLDGVLYQKEKTELSHQQFYQEMIQNHVFPKTSLPSVDDYYQAFLPYAKTGTPILCLTITSHLSGSIHSAETAKQILLETYPKQEIYILDSWQATGSLALLVQACSQMQANGIPFSQVVSQLEDLKKTGGIYFMVGSLKYLEKGGRIGKLAALGGNLLQIKPIIALANGEISSAGAVRTRKKGLLKILSHLTELFSQSEMQPEQYQFSIGSTNTPEEAVSFAQMIMEAFPSICAPAIFQIGATIASHTGPDTIGLCYLKKRL